MKLVGVLMAGGKGERFWPLSRKEKPKQLLSLFDESKESLSAAGRSMIEITVDRVRPLIPSERILVVTAAPLVPAIRNLLPDIPEENVIGEPVGRNTAPCIAMAARIAEKRWGEDTVLLVKGADYRIGKPGFFLKIVSVAAEFAAGGDRVVTLGLTPTRAETGYGYIERKEYPTFERESVSIFPVRSFREKPDANTAQEFCRSGRFYWNSGMFVWTCRTVRKSVRKHAPEISLALDEIEDRLGTTEQEAALEQMYPGLPTISIDYAVMEKSENVYVAPADIEWDDVGSWTALERYGEKDPDGNVISVPHVGVDTRGCIVAGAGGLVATLGVTGLLIVRTGDVVLVADKNRDQEVKQLLSLCEQDPEKKKFT